MSTSTIIGTMRAAISYAERAENAELLAKLRDAQAGLLETIDMNLELQSQTESLRKEVEQLRTTLAIKAELEFVNGLYYPKSELNEQREPNFNTSPVCQRCLEVDHLVTHVQWLRREKHFECAACKTVYQDHFR
jgi:hypothetical protein